MSSANLMLVEGPDDLHAVVNLLKHNLSWQGAGPPFLVKDMKGVNNLLDEDELAIAAKAPGLSALGVIVDADDEFLRRWQAIERFCKQRFRSVPSSMPPDGLIVENDAGLRFGAWIMPDNLNKGMLETFLKTLVPAASAPLRAHAEKATDDGKALGAPWRRAHRDKAIIHAYLAWGDPPGRPFGQAISAKILDPASPSAKPFVDWVKRLYQLA